MTSETPRMRSSSRALLSARTELSKPREIVGQNDDVVCHSGTLGDRRMESMGGDASDVLRMNRSGSTRTIYGC
jgi:hypothetical protein